MGLGSWFANRRNGIILKEIDDLLRNGQESAVLANIYYEAAQKFAVDHGAKLSGYKNDPADDTLAFRIDREGRTVSVVVSRWKKDETYLSVKPAEKYF